MAHHNFDPEQYRAETEVLESIKDKFRTLEDEASRLYDFGATGKFPHGRLTPGDEGEIRFGVAVGNGKVLVDFGKPVHSLGMLPQQARDFAVSLMKAAATAEKNCGSEE